MQFPDNPTDGQQVIQETEDDGILVWTYDKLNQQWTYKAYEPNKGKPVIYTDEVLVRNLDLENFPELTTQMAVNQLLGDELGLSSETLNKKVG
jgi:hypothetical protein